MSHIPVIPDGQSAIKLIGSELVSIYQYLVPVFAAIGSVCIGLAHLHLIQVIAMAAIVAGMLLTNRGKRKKLATPVDK